MAVLEIRRLEAIVGFTQAYAQFLGQLALGDLGVLFDELDDPVGNFFVQFC